MKQFVAATLTAAMLLPLTATAGVYAGPAALQKAKMQDGKEVPVRQGLKVPGITHRAAPVMKNFTNANRLPAKVTTKSGMQKLTAASNANLYASLIYAMSWEEAGAASYGLYDVDPNYGTATSVIDDASFQGAGTYNPLTGQIVVNNVQTFWGFVMSMDTYVWDYASQTIVDHFTHSTDTYDSYCTNMACDPVTGTVYAITYDAEGVNFNLTTFDFDNGVYNVVAPLTGRYSAMAIDGAGQMYVIDTAGDCYTMDKSTGLQGDLVVSTGYTPEYMQSACYSPVDKAIIWLATSNDDSKIISIDPVAGTSEVLCVLTDLEEYTCAFTTDPFAEDGAPGRPELSLSVASPGDLDATISMVAPSVNVAGEALTGSMSGKLFVDNVEVKSYASLSAGQEVSEPYTFTNGTHAVRFVCSNDFGDGFSASASMFFGEDAPKAVQNLSVSVADDGTATVTWDAPTEGVNGGWVNPAKLNYTVACNGVVAAEGLTSTSYSEVLGSDLASYVYTVTAFSGTVEGETATSNVVTFGDALAVPYFEDFTTAKDISLYTIVDNNEDGSTWALSASGMLRYTYNMDNNADDYAMTPPIKMETGKVYELTIVASSYMSYYPERIEVTLGTSVDPLTHTTVLIEPTDLTTGSQETLSAFFMVPADGTYNVGIHAISDADQFYLNVYSINVDFGPSVDAPAAVSDAAATPGDQGALTATLSFTAPSLSFGGEALTEDVTVTATRGDGVVVGSATVAPGAAGSIVDSDAANGENSYTLVTSNSAGTGDKVTVSCVCGFATPGPVEDFKAIASDDNMSATLSWTAPSAGVGGGYFDVASLYYTIYYYDSTNQIYVALDETTETTYTVPAVSSTELTGYTYVVTACNSGGESDMEGATVVLGTPYSVPFSETLENSEMTTSPWYLTNDGSYATCGMSPGIEGLVTPEDGGMFAFYDAYAWLGGTCTLQVPKMKLNGMADAKLKFPMYHYADDATLRVLVTDNTGVQTELLSTLLNSAEGWVEYSLDLSRYANAPWIQIEFEGTVDEGAYICIDDIVVDRDYANNIAVNSVSGPTSLRAGVEGTFSAVVSNKGTQDATFSVNFLVDGALAETVEQTTALAQGESTTLSFTFTPTADQIGKKVVVSAQAVLAGATDEDEADNSRSCEVSVMMPSLATVTDLAGEPDASLQNVVLSWSEPTMIADPVVEGFEGYEPFVIGDMVGNFLTIDVDGQSTYGINGYPFPNAYSAMSFMVWDADSVGLTTEQFAPYAGDQCLIAFASVPETGGNDDWLISPEVVPGSTISFMANISMGSLPETWEVLYSTTTQDIEAFTVLASETKTSTGWAEYSYTLPENAKYFAIHLISYDQYALLLDDISYVPAGASSDVTLMGYNVYVDGVLVNETPIAETTYTYTSDVPASELSFNVTAVYDAGESIFSNTVTFTSGLSDVKTMGVKVYGLNKSIRVENVQGHAVSVYTTDGKLLRSVKATNNSINIPAMRGVYVVKVDNSSAKVQVK